MGFQSKTAFSCRDITDLSLTMPCRFILLADVNRCPFISVNVSFEVISSFWQHGSLDCISGTIVNEVSPAWCPLTIGENCMIFSGEEMLGSRSVCAESYLRK